MVCCTKKPYLCVVAVLALVAIFLNAAAFIAPGWLMLERSLTAYDYRMFSTEAMFDEEVIGGELPPQATGGPVAMAKRSARRMTERPGHHNDFMATTTTDQRMPPMEEMKEVEAWFFTAVVDISHVKLRVNYGLWYSKLCVHEQHLATEEVSGMIMQEEDVMPTGIDDKFEPRMMEKRSAHESSSESHSEETVAELEHDRHHGHKQDKHHCRKISTQCALYYGTIFDDEEEGRGSMLHHHLARRLTEFRVELTTALVLLIVGLLVAVCMLRKESPCKYAVVAAFFKIMFSVLLTFIPVFRFAKLSMCKHAQALPVYVHPPVSVICAGLGAIVSMITAVVIMVGYFRMLRNKRASGGNWYKFNNELEIPTEEKKGAQLVFVTEPLPEKPGM